MFIEPLEDRRFFAASPLGIEPNALPASVVAVAGESPVVVFADTALESIVRAALRKPQGQITRTDMLRLTRMENEQYFRDRVIRSLEGLQYATNLRRLDLGFWPVRTNDLSPLARLVKLESLSIYGGGTYTDLSQIGRLRALKYLSLRGRFEDLGPLAGLKRLEELYLHGRFTSARPLTGLRRLETLVLESTQIESLDGLQGLDSVRQMRLGTPLVRGLKAVGGMSDLRVLRVGYGRIDNLEGLSNAAELREVHLQGNRISDVGELTKLKWLRVVDLSGNRIRLTPRSEAVEWAKALRRRGRDVDIEYQDVGPSIVLDRGEEPVTRFVTWEPMDLGTVEVGEWTAPQRLLVRNVGNDPLMITAVRVPEGVELMEPLPTSIEPDGSAPLVVRFRADQPGRFYQEVLIESNSGLQTPLAVPLMARAADDDGRVTGGNPTGNVYRGRFDSQSVGWFTGYGGENEGVIKVVKWLRDRAVLLVEGERWDVLRDGDALDRPSSASTHAFFHARYVGDTIVGEYSFNHRIYRTTFKVYLA